MNNSTSHSLAVKTPLSRLYLALFSAPLLLFLPADIARAADAFFDGDARITETLGYTGDVYVGRNQRGNLLIDNGKSPPITSISVGCSTAKFMKAWSRSVLMSTDIARE